MEEQLPGGMGETEWVRRVAVAVAIWCCIWYNLILSALYYSAAEGDPRNGS